MNRRVATIQVVTIAAVLGLYELLAHSGLLYAGVVPPLESIAAALGAALADATTYRHLGVSAYEVAVGFAIALVAGTACGIALGTRPLVGAALGPYVDGLATAPKIVFLPIAMLLFGVGLNSKIALGALSAFFPIVLTVAAAVRNIDPVLVRVGRSFIATPLQMTTKIYIPALIPAMVTGMRLGLGLAIIGVLLAEIKFSDRGFGFLTIDDYNHYRIPHMYALLLVVFALAVVANALIGRIERSVGQPRRDRR